jgi:hypothetical protein
MADLLTNVAPPRTIDDLIACAEREIGFRCRVYANFVRKGTMTQAVADEEIARMRDIRDLLRLVQKASKLAPPSERFPTTGDEGWLSHFELVRFARGER